MENTDTAKRIEERIDNLPLIDVTVFETMSLLNSPDSNFEQIVEKLSPDIAARFLNIANSAYYGIEVRSINHAVRLLGYSQMKQILVTSILIEHFTKHLKDFSFEKFQKQAQFCAAVSRILGEIVDYGRLEDLFTVSILNNIGKLVIAVYFGEEHKKIIGLKKSKRMTTSEAERNILGTTHAEIGAHILEKFNIPAEICDAVRFHVAEDRDIPENGNFKLGLIIREATRLVGRFKLPEDMNYSDIVERMKGTIKKGRESYQSGMRLSIQTRNYKKAFTKLLEEASDLISQDLKGLQERAPR